MSKNFSVIQARPNVTALFRSDGDDGPAIFPVDFWIVKMDSDGSFIVEGKSCEYGVNDRLEDNLTFIGYRDHLDLTKTRQNINQGHSGANLWA